LAFFTRNKARLFKNLIITLAFEKNAIFSPKIVFITSVPGRISNTYTLTYILKVHAWKDAISYGRDKPHENAHFYETK
jgi:hypothetical protein